MADDGLSRQYHSLRLYDGTYITTGYTYRIGNKAKIIEERTERYYDTWDDFHLIPTERPDVTVPAANTKIISIPGRRMPIDMTNYLTGHPTYANRTGQWSFFVDNDYVESRLGGWVAFDKQIRSLFNGHISKIVLMDDASYFYAGSLTMGQWNTGHDRSTITIAYNLYPYKKSMVSSMDMWKFDDFDFEEGYITYLKDLEVDGTRIVTVYGSPERISPRISGTGGLMYVDKYENSTWVSYGKVPIQSIDSPEAIIPRLIIDDDLTRLRFRGLGTVTIDYRRGLL